MLPSFLVIGAQESATSTLYWNLARHPSVRAAERKEVHFFDLHFARGLSWYRSHFPASLPGAPRFVTGEASPYYLFHPHVPGRVARTLPDVKLLAVLRNPVDRAFHHHQHNRARGFETEDFENALEREAREFARTMRALAEHPDDPCPSHRHGSYFARGIYVDQLRAWEERFGRENLWVIATDELFAEPEESLSKAAWFLGLEGWRPSSTQNFEPSRADLRDPRLRAKLRDRFAPHNERLYAYLGRRLPWD